MKKLLSAAVWVVSTFSLFANPYAGYLYPAGVKAGSTVRVLIGGQNFNGITGGTVTGKGVRIKRVVPVPGFPLPDGSQRAWIYKWLDGIEKGNTEKPEYPDPEKMEGWRKCTWWDKLDQLEPLELSLTLRNLYVRRNSLQQTPSLRSMVILDVEADADAAPGVRELRIYGRRGVSAPKLFFVDKCDHYKEPLYVPPNKMRPDTVQVKSVPAVVNGQIMPGETDSFVVKLEANTDYTFTLTGRSFQPFIGDAVPGHFQPVLQVIDPDGKDLAFADDEFFLPDPVLRFKSNKAGNYLLKVRDNLYRGREDFVYRVAMEKGRKSYKTVIKSFNDLDETDENEAGQRKLSITRPLVICGVIDRPGEVDEFCFKGVKGMKFHAEIAARRDGSPLDGVLTLYAPDGKKIVQADDDAKQLNVGLILQQIDPALRTTLPADGVYRIEVSELNKEGGKEFRYKLRLGEEEPDFNVYTVRSMCNVNPNGGGSVKVLIERTGGFDGEIYISGSKRFVPEQKIKAGAKEAAISLRYPDRRFTPPFGVKIFAEAEINGRKVRKAVVPADIFNQAFAYDHLLPAEEFCIGVRRYGNWNKNKKQNNKKVQKTVPAKSKAKTSAKK